MFNLLNSKTTLACYNVENPSIALSQTKNNEVFKLYVADTGLFTTMIFNSTEQADEDIYTKLLSDNLPADLGYMYENIVAQIITASGRPLYYHTWEKENSTHYYEVDFILTSKTKLIPVEVKSSGLGKHESINQFCIKYSKYVVNQILLSQKDVGHKEELKLYPIYMLPFILEDL